MKTTIFSELVPRSERSLASDLETLEQSLWTEWGTERDGTLYFMPIRLGLGESLGGLIE